VRSDLFEKITGEFDLIVANLPYIPSGEITNLSREVKRDPLNALDGGADGLLIIQRLLSEAPDHLGDGGAIALELHHDQAETVSARLVELGYKSVESASDLGGIERFVFAVRPERPPVEPTPHE
jgi:release factor glutamine methyltransferase